MIEPLSWQDSWHNQSTTGATKSGLIPSIISVFLNKSKHYHKTSVVIQLLSVPGGRIPWVRREPAIGTIVLQWMLYLPPSSATVLLKPTRPSLAALWKHYKIFKSHSESDNNLYSPVVRLAKISIDSCNRRGHNNTTIFLFAEVRPGCFGGNKRSPQVDSMNQIPVIVVDFDKRPVSQNPSIVDKNINSSKIINSSLDNFVTFLNRVVISNSFATLINFSKANNCKFIKFWV